MQYSRNITQSSASNLVPAFVLLPKPKREDMSALYAFCRQVDDVADDESLSADTRREQLARWRADVVRSCGTDRPEFPVNRELQRVIHQYRLPFDYFDELLKGVEMDLSIKAYSTFEELELYCYRVASVVGLLSIEIFGYQDQRCKEYATYLGKALQLTNILRDVRADAERSRIYLPRSELERHGVSPHQIFSMQYSEAFVAVASSVANRARHFYRLARETLPSVDRRSMVAAELMGSVYWRLLQKLERQRFAVFGPKLTKLNKGQKALLLLSTWGRFAFGGMSPNYGF
jgi:phytoene synthase